MLSFLLLFGLALGAVPPLDDSDSIKLQRGNCPMFWFSFNGRCYKYVSAPLTWVDAELHCVSEGANLVSIHSLEEQKFIESLIKHYGAARTWIGLSDIHKEDTWMWSDGSAVKFVFWSEGEPNNVEHGTEHCVHDYLGPQGWNDVPCSLMYPSICKSRITCP